MTRTLAFAALLATIALSACGPSALGGGTGSDGGSSATEPPLLHESGPHVLAVAAASIVHGPFHVHLAGNDGRGDIVLDASVDGSGNLLGSLSVYNHAGQIAIIGDSLFLKGAELISEQTGSPSNVSTWVRYLTHPPTYFDTLRQGEHLSKCFADLGGNQTTGSRATVNGQDTVEVDGAGDAQGGAATKLFVSVGETAVVVRWVIAHSGQAPPDSCNGGQVARTAAAALPAGSVDFSNVGTPVSIYPPAGAVDAQ